MSSNNFNVYHYIQSPIPILLIPPHLLTSKPPLNPIPSIFWRTWAKSYETVVECKQSIGEFIRKYNQQRLHQSLKEYDTPLEAYLQTKLAVVC